MSILFTRPTPFLLEGGVLASSRGLCSLWIVAFGSKYLLSMLRFQDVRRQGA